ncbi:MAG: DUF937 domain-containing protein [Pseudomonadota bacterium]|uniref:DUF937 domain-containing protein n=1 Tax=Sphingomonas sp. ERG5 TaxID=1381597 RepID=UPI00054BBAA7|nr:DUF937 domain-containing protein [Sphingomonas sp. ERG5]
MNIMDIINQAGGISAISSQLGIDEGTAQAGAAALLPAILGGMKGQAQQHPDGLSGLAGILGSLGGGGLLANILAPGASDVDAGNNVLGQIFGSKDVSRTVADHAAAQSGVSSDLLRKMLPLLAMAVAGYLAKQAGGAQPGSADAGQQSGLGGMLGGLVGSILGGGQQAAAQPAPAAGGLGGLGALGSLIDMNHDGNPLDDILGMAGKLAGR